MAPKKVKCELCPQFQQDVAELKTRCSEIQKDVAAIKDHFKKCTKSSQQVADLDCSRMPRDTASGGDTHPPQQQAGGTLTYHAQRGSNQTLRIRTPQTPQQPGNQSGWAGNLPPLCPPPQPQPIIMVPPSPHCSVPLQQTPAPSDSAPCPARDPSHRSQAPDQSTQVWGYSNAEREADKLKTENANTSHRMSYTEQELRRELELTRLQHDQMKKEAEDCKKAYAEFRQRMQYQVSNELDCSGARSENIMDPCRESEVIKMYNSMKTQSWGETREKLLKHGLKGTQLCEHVEKLIEKMFEDAGQHAKKIKSFIDNICIVQPATFPNMTLLHEKSPYHGGDVMFAGTWRGDQCRSPRIRAYLNKVTHDFQMIFYYCDLNYYKSVVKEYVSQYCTDHGGVCIDLAAECYKVAILMALHEPQLIPVWDARSYDTSNLKSQKVFPTIYKNNLIICHSE